MDPGATTQHSDQGFEGRVERERIHYNRRARVAKGNSLWMEEANILRYANASLTTPFPLEYAFHLLGPLDNKTVVDLGCGDGLNTVILSALAGRVIAVDISDESLRLTEERARVNAVERNVTFVHSDTARVPIDDETADLVLCAAILHHVDCIATATQIRRILKPGGRAVFLEPMMGPGLFAAIKQKLPKSADVTDDERPLTMQQVTEVSETIGSQGRSREFGLIARVLQRASVRSLLLINGTHHLDALMLRWLPILRTLASPLVWEAQKV